ncbi:hypothetical protein DTO217A2_8855 [Paecilomyces variotii]|nr:hypothetical protein DTO217A2_8855 [Paecilomyces variotii]
MLVSATPAIFKLGFYSPPVRLNVNDGVIFTATNYGVLLSLFLVRIIFEFWSKLYGVVNTSTRRELNKAK